MLNTESYNNSLFVSDMRFAASLLRHFLSQSGAAFAAVNR